MTKKEVKENFQKFRRCCLNITQYDCDGNDDFGCESSCPYYMSNKEILETLKAVEDILESMTNTEIVHCWECKTCQYDPLFNEYWCNGKKVDKNGYCREGKKREE